jgi:CHAD domain-containing protein
MAHLIERDEDFGVGLLRLVREDLAGIREVLSSDLSPDERIHRARQRLKRLRTLARVLRPTLGIHAAPLKADLGTTSRLLAGARDADVAVESARAMRKLAGDKPGHGFDAVVAALAEEARATHAASLPIETVQGRLVEIERHFAVVTAIDDGAALFAESLVGAYRRGRNSFQRASESLATPDLHRWRKAVKDLWHLLKLGREHLPAKAKPLADRLDRLAGLLGSDHDLALLAERLALSPRHDPALGLQLSVIATERRRLENEALKRGARLYRHKPAELARRMKLD